MGRLAERFGNRRPQRIFLGLRAVIFPAVAATALLVGNPKVLLVIAFFFIPTGTSWAFVSLTGLSIVSKLADERLRGQAIGTHYAIIGFGGIIGASVGGSLANLNYLAAFATASALVLAGLLLTRKIKY